MKQVRECSNERGGCGRLSNVDVPLPFRFVEGGQNWDNSAAAGGSHHGGPEGVS